MVGARAQYWSAKKQKERTNNGGPKEVSFTLSHRCLVELWVECLFVVTEKKIWFNFPPLSSPSFTFLDKLGSFRYLISHETMPFKWVCRGWEVSDCKFRQNFCLHIGFFFHQFELETVQESKWRKVQTYLCNFCPVSTQAEDHAILPRLAYSHLPIHDLLNYLCILILQLCRSTLKFCHDILG
jgi:hypothetical protein